MSSLLQFCFFTIHKNVFLDEQHKNIECFVFQLTVIPQINPFEFEGEVNTGEGVQLTCYVGKGDLPLNISWSFNTKRIRNVFGVATVPVGSQTNLLIINSVQPEHAGVYSCQASNLGGNVEQSAELFVNGDTITFKLIFLIICFYLYHLS